jgi:uncharacterized membrane protein
VLILLSCLGQAVRLYTSHDYLWGLITLFNLNAEHNVPSFFSAFMLGVIALLLGAIFQLHRRRRDAGYWLVLALGFCLMAVDETISLHEQLAPPIRSLLKNDGHLGVFYFAWVIPGFVVVAIVGLSYRRFLWRLAPTTRRAFLVSAGLYLGGALGMEMLGGWYREAHGYAGLGYALMTTVEESLEMLGSIYFIRSLLHYLRSQAADISLVP